MYADFYNTLKKTVKKVQAVFGTGASVVKAACI